MPLSPQRLSQVLWKENGKPGGKLFVPPPPKTKEEEDNVCAPGLPPATHTLWGYTPV